MFSTGPKWVTYVAGLASIATIIGVYIAYLAYTKPSLSPDGTPSGTPSVVATLASATTPGTSSPNNLTVNRQLVCVNNCDSVAGLKIVVLSFTFDTAQGQTSMNLSLAAQRNYSSCNFSYPGSGAIGESLNFQDSTGKVYEPGGQLEHSYKQFSLRQGQSIELAGIYSFLPSSGSHYTLVSTGLSCDQVHDYPVYETVKFTF